MPLVSNYCCVGAGSYGGGAKDSLNLNWAMADFWPNREQARIKEKLLVQGFHE